MSGYHFEPCRDLGRTGFRATVLGIGDLSDRAVGAEECVALLHRAMDAGLNVIDTAGAYENGFSEQVVGRALRGRREGMFVIDKVDELDEPVRPQVEASLERLGLPSVDAFVMHGLSSIEGWREAASPGGSMQQLSDCIAAGMCRFRGISSHHPAVLSEAIESGLCDVVLFAIGPDADVRYEQEILPLARARGVGTVCFKTFGAGMLVSDTSGYGAPLAGRAAPRDDVPPELPHLDASDCVAYTLTAGPDVALLGLCTAAQQDLAFAAAAGFSPLSPERMEDLRTAASGALEGKGASWWNPQ